MTPRPPQPPDFPASQLFLRRLAFHLVRDEAQAEDLVQETWTAWIEHPPKGVVEPRAWLARVLRNRAFNLRRSEDRRTRREQLAGRPDVSSPETDGTLEAQAQLLEALRKLDEPFRSTLLQRYYHDLSPKAIAERSGTPLNTVKARLARGLDKLRRAMDRRYGGDRRAWCHWLTILGPQGVMPLDVPHSGAPPVAPLGPGPGYGLASPLGGLGLLGKSVLLAVLGLSALTWVLWRTQRAPLVSFPPGIEGEMDPARSETAMVPGGGPPKRKAVRPEKGPSPVLKTRPKETPPEFAAPLPFDWPQIGGTPTHQGLPPSLERQDRILRPRVRTYFAGLAGQPTVRGTVLYSGGATLYRVDLEKDAVSTLSQDASGSIPTMAKWRQRERTWGWKLDSQGLTEDSNVCAAPALMEDLVLARLVEDGSVVAFDADLTQEVWRWEPAEPGPCALSGCLIGGLFLVAHDTEVVALRAVNGSVEWRYAVDDGDGVDMVPATDGDLVYFGTRHGAVLALELARGKERWRRPSQGSFAWSLPLAMADRVVLTDNLRRDYAEVRGRRNGALRAFQSYDGRELWTAMIWNGPPSNPGMGDGVITFQGSELLSAWSIDTGEQAWVSTIGGTNPRATPTWVGDSIVGLEERNRFVVRDAETGEVRWAYQAEVPLLDFVHAGDQVYLTTSNGLLCIADDPGAEPAPPGFVLDGKKDRPGRRR